MMRWILFVPYGLVAGNFVAALFSTLALWVLGPAVSWAVYGHIIAIVIPMFGLQMAPQKTSAVKWILLAVPGILAVVILTIPIPGEVYWHRVMAAGIMAFEIVMLSTWNVRAIVVGEYNTAEVPERRREEDLG